MDEKFNETDQAKDNQKDRSETEMIERIENAYKVYKLSEIFLQDVEDDYGKQKIAKLRLEFARHELITLLQEAREKGIEWKNNEVVKNLFFNKP